jgi:hypothetical protein
LKESSRSKSKLVMDYTPRNFRRPIGVAEWETKIVNKLPAELRGSLPAVEEIEAELMRKGGLEKRPTFGRRDHLGVPGR